MHFKELMNWYCEYKKHSVIGGMKEFKVFYIFLMYKKYTDSINNNSFSFLLFKESFKNQTAVNFFKICIKVLLRKISK
jgi:hypothetical protein